MSQSAVISTKDVKTYEIEKYLKTTDTNNAMELSDSYLENLQSQNEKNNNCSITSGLSSGLKPSTVSGVSTTEIKNSFNSTASKFVSGNTVSSPLTGFSEQSNISTERFNTMSQGVNTGAMSFATSATKNTVDTSNSGSSSVTEFATTISSLPTTTQQKISEIAGLNTSNVSAMNNVKSNSINTASSMSTSNSTINKVLDQTKIIKQVPSDGQQNVFNGVDKVISDSSKKYSDSVDKIDESILNMLYFGETGIRDDSGNATNVINNAPYLNGDNSLETICNYGYDQYPNITQNGESLLTNMSLKEYTSTINSLNVLCKDLGLSTESLLDYLSNKLLFDTLLDKILSSRSMNLLKSILDCVEYIDERTKEIANSHTDKLLDEGNADMLDTMFNKFGTDHIKDNLYSSRRLVTNYTGTYSVVPDPPDPPSPFPIATKTNLGAVKVGKGFNTTSDGTISAMQFTSESEGSNVLGKITFVDDSGAIHTRSIMSDTFSSLTPVVDIPNISSLDKVLAHLNITKDNLVRDENYPSSYDAKNIITMSVKGNGIIESIIGEDKLKIVNTVFAKYA